MVFYLVVVVLAMKSDTRYSSGFKASNQREHHSWESSEKMFGDGASFLSKLRKTNARCGW